MAEYCWFALGILACLMVRPIMKASRWCWDHVGFLDRALCWTAGVAFWCWRQVRGGIWIAYHVPQNPAIGSGRIDWRRNPIAPPAAGARVVIKEDLR